MYPTSIDLAIAAWFHAHATPLVTHLMLFLTNVQSNLAIGVMSAAIAVALLRKRDMLWLVTLALLVPTGLAMNVLFKHACARVRPVFEDPLLTLTSFSFPSGHVAGATLFYGFLVAYLWERAELPAARALLVGAAVLLVTLVALRESTWACITSRTSWAPRRGVSPGSQSSWAGAAGGSRGEYDSRDREHSLRRRFRRREDRRSGQAFPRSRPRGAHLHSSRRRGDRWPRHYVKDSLLDGFWPLTATAQSRSPHPRKLSQYRETSRYPAIGASAPISGRP